MSPTAITSAATVNGLPFVTVTSPAGAAAEFVMPTMVPTVVIVNRLPTTFETSILPVVEFVAANVETAVSIELPLPIPLTAVSPRALAVMLFEPALASTMAPAVEVSSTRGAAAVIA